MIFWLDGHREFKHQGSYTFTKRGYYNLCTIHTGKARDSETKEALEKAVTAAEVVGGMYSATVHSNDNFIVKNDSQIELVSVGVLFFPHTFHPLQELRVGG